MSVSCLVCVCVCVLCCAVRGLPYFCQLSCVCVCVCAVL
jgi:hypothetical protein